jgi:hypothetical protein
LLSVAICQCQRQSQRHPPQNAKQKVSSLIGKLRNMKLSYDPNKIRRSNKKPTLTSHIGLTRQGRWPNNHHIRFNRDSPPPQQQQQYQEEQPLDVEPPAPPPPPESLPLAPNPYNPPEVIQPVEPAPPTQPSEPLVPTYNEQPAEPPAPTYNERPAEPSPPITTEQPTPPPPAPTSPIIYKFKLLDAITSTTEKLETPAGYPLQRENIPAPVYTPRQQAPPQVYPQREVSQPSTYPQREPIPAQKPFEEGEVFPKVITQSIAEFASTIDKDGKNVYLKGKLF